MKNSSILIIFLVSFITTEANAYIDPGTGSFIIQAILAIGASIVFYLGYPIRFIKKIFSKDKQKKNQEKSQEKNSS